MNILYEKFMLCVFLVGLLIVIYGLYDTWYVYHNAQDSSYLRFKPTVEEGVPEEAPITDDMVAWITVDDTNIDYPIMQGNDNSKYLNINPYGEYSLSGSIFLDSRNSKNFSDYYSILYGHHMSYGSMFGALDDFLSTDFLMKHKTGTLLVGRKNVKEYSFRIFASMKVNVFENDLLDPGIGRDIQKLIKKSAYVYDDSVKIDDSARILVLSTCTEPVSTNRLLVFCYIED